MRVPHGSPSASTHRVHLAVRPGHDEPGTSCPVVRVTDRA